MSVQITVRYRSIDRFSETRSFKTLKGARKYVVRRVGEHPEIGCGYAASGDGVGVLRVEGCLLSDLFPEAG